VREAWPFREHRTLQPTRVLVAIVVSMATVMEVLDTSIANVSLGHIAGSLGAGQTEAVWVLTSYLAVNAVIIPISGWLSVILGRKRFYMLCVALFTVSSFLCGISPSLGLLLCFRVLQGVGGGLAPSEQAVLADTFPGKSLGMAFAVYAIAVVVAPAVGPTLGGWITENYSWRWIFFMNVPVGVLSLLLTSRLIQDPPRRGGDKTRTGTRTAYRLYWIRFHGACFWLSPGCVGQGTRRGLVGFDVYLHFPGILTLIGFLGLIVWETLVTKDPIVDFPLLGNANLATSMVLQFVVGFILNATTVLIPQFAQQLLGYSALDAGRLGLALMFIFPIAGQQVRWVQPKYLMAIGLTTLRRFTDGPSRRF